MFTANEISVSEIRSVRKRIKATTKKLDDKLDTLKSKVKGDESDSEDEKDKTKEKKKEERKQKEQEKKDNKDSGYADTTGASLRRSDGALGGAPELFRSTSAVSAASNVSKKSEEAKSNIPIFDPAAPAVIDDGDDDDDDEEDDHDEHAFDHPSTYIDQPWIWLPRDQLGLSELLANDLKAAGVDASDVGASMDKKGIVEVTRNPPDEEWRGGHDK